MEYSLFLTLCLSLSISFFLSITLFAVEASSFYYKENKKRCISLENVPAKIFGRLKRRNQRTVFVCRVYTVYVCTQAELSIFFLGRENCGGCVRMCPLIFS